MLEAVVSGHLDGCSQHRDGEQWKLLPRHEALSAAEGLARKEIASLSHGEPGVVGASRERPVRPKARQ